MRRRKTRENIEKRVYEHTDEKIEKKSKKREIVKKGPILLAKLKIAFSK